MIHEPRAHDARTPHFNSVTQPVKPHDPEASAGSEAASAACLGVLTGVAAATDRGPARFRAGRRHPAEHNGRAPAQRGGAGPGDAVRADRPW